MGKREDKKKGVERRRETTARNNRNEEGAEKILPNSPSVQVEQQGKEEKKGMVRDDCGRVAGLNRGKTRKE